MIKKEITKAPRTCRRCKKKIPNVNSYCPSCGIKILRKYIKDLYAIEKDLGY